MSAQSVTLRARLAAEKLMADTCSIVRVTGQVEGPGGVITPTTTTVYTGKCRMMVRTRERLGGSWVEAGEAQVIASRLELQLPVSAPEVLEGDRVTMTVSTLDPVMQGKTYVVRDAMVKTHLVHRRVTVMEVSS